MHLILMISKGTSFMALRTWIMAAMLFVFVPFAFAQQAQTEVTARATVVAPLEIENIQDLDFGSFPAGISPVAMSPVTGESNPNQVGPAFGRLLITSGLTGNPEISITAPASMVMTGQDSENMSETLTVTLLYAKNQDTSASTGDILDVTQLHELSNDGDLLIIVGGSIESNPASQPTGFYQGEISISVTLDI